MFTLSNLPRNGVLRIYATCDVVTPESAAEGMASESGWVSSLSSSDVYESRNDVRPLVELRVNHSLPLSSPPARVFLYDSAVADVLTSEEADEEAREDIARIVAELGAYDTDGGSTLYAAGSVIFDYSTAAEYRFAIHARVKHYDALQGWVESPVSLVE